MPGSTFQLIPSALDLDSVPVSANPAQSHSSAASQDAFDTLIHRIHHDLNGPLASIAGLVQIARMEKDLPAVIDHLDTIHRLSNKLTGILEELLEVNQLHSERPRPHWIDIEQELELVVSGYSEWPEARDITLTVESDHCSFFTDPNRLRSALNHLVSNAIIHHDPEKSKKWISVHSASAAGQLRIEILDNGKGIEEQFLPKVFDMFSIGEHQGRGSGLGLYLAKEAINSMGGTLEIQSDRGRGTKATIYFPI